MWQSLVTPQTVIDYDVFARTSTVLKRQEVRGGHDPADYVQRREWATAPDGTQVPLSLVHHRDTPLDGTAPGLLHGYGAYGIPSDPWFSVLRLSLLQRGWIFAIAHVREGSEMVGPGTTTASSSASATRSPTSSPARTTCESDVSSTRTILQQRVAQPAGCSWVWSPTRPRTGSASSTRPCPSSMP